MYTFLPHNKYLLSLVSNYKIKHITDANERGEREENKKKNAFGYK